MTDSPFMQRVREIIRLRQLAYATEKTYCYWIRFFIRHQSYSQPAQIEEEGVTRFLTWLAEAVTQSSVQLTERRPLMLRKES